jgi:hypothetical protein
MQGHYIFSVFHSVETNLGVTRSMQCVWGALSPEVMWLGREAGYLSVSTAEVNNGGASRAFPLVHLLLS